MRTVDLVTTLQGEEVLSVERLARRFNASIRTVRSHIHQANSALEGVAQAQPKKKKGSGAKRSRVTKSAQGIKVSMPSKKKK